jgi:hypothetical protein
MDEIIEYGQQTIVDAIEKETSVSMVDPEGLAHSNPLMLWINYDSLAQPGISYHPYMWRTR